jgi:hypothetical protein
MPCIKCANGKYKYGEHDNCQFDTLAACKAAAAAIHIQENNMTPVEPQAEEPQQPQQPQNPQPSDWHCETCQCAMCKSWTNSGMC